MQSLYLLADSQLLFWNSPSGAFLASVLKSTGRDAPRIAYIGASNGDSPDAFSILKAAVERLPIGGLRMVSASFPAEDQQFLQTADVVVLSGGDVETGWNVFTRTGLYENIVSRYRDGAVLVGVSAGAVQLGMHAAVPAEGGSSRLVETFGFVPLIVEVHDERGDWKALSDTIHLLEGTARGVGIPSGGGLIVHPDGTLEPVRRQVEEFSFRDGNLRRAVLFPPA